MGDIDTEVPACNYMPTAKKLFIHVLLDLLGDLLFVRTVLHSMVDDMLGLELHLGLHLGVEHLYAPFLCAFDVFGVHFVCYYNVLGEWFIIVL